jgi:hypothetical protein
MNDDRRPTTHIERVAARILLSVDNEPIADVRMALDVAAGFLGTLGLKPDQCLTDCKSQDDEPSFGARLH